LDSTVKIFSSPTEVAEKFAEEFASMINESASQKKNLTVALSGGSTPELLFSILGNRYSKDVNWQYVHFFWGDERCVPPENTESNFGMTQKKLFSKIDIPPSNIHRIRGEQDPANEVARYSVEIAGNTRTRDGFPLFDLIILGLGEDGHTASIFPGNIGLFNSFKICEVAVHPITRMKRVTITGRVINNADSVVFLVTGKSKATIVGDILNRSNQSNNFPGSFVVPVHGLLSWFIDKDAGSLL
jgi:6-phosphogluconolactonase